MVNSITLGFGNGLRLHCVSAAIQANITKRIIVILIPLDIMYIIRRLNCRIFNEIISRLLSYLVKEMYKI